MTKQICNFFWVVSLYLLICCFSANAALLGVNWEGTELHQIDPTSGVVQKSIPINNLQLPVGVGGLAATLENDLYFFDCFYDSLYRLNKITGSVDKIGNLGINVYEGGMSFNPVTEKMYGAYAESPSNNTFSFFSVDFITGETSTISAPEEFDDISGMAFTPTGDLYVIDSKINTTNQPLLYKINISTNDLNIMGEFDLSGVAAGVKLGLTYDYTMDKLLFTAGETGILYSIDMDFGYSWSEIGPIGDGSISISGLVSTSNSVPLPSSIFLLALSVAGLFAVKVQKQKERQNGTR